MEKNTKKAERSVKQISVSALALILSVVLLIGAVVGGTLAWLMKKTEPIQNTFVLGNITGLTLTDNHGNNSLELYANQKLQKSTILTVGANSVNSYVYIKIETSANFTDYVTDGITTEGHVNKGYVMADGWTYLLTDAGADVYYREYTKTETATPYQVLKGDTEYTTGLLQAKAQMDFPDYSDGGVSDDYTSDKPWIKFTGYAVQKEAGAQQSTDDQDQPITIYTALQAWNEINAQINAQNNNGQ